MQSSLTKHKKCRQKQSNKMKCPLLSHLQHYLTVSDRRHQKKTEHKNRLSPSVFDIISSITDSPVQLDKQLSQTGTQKKQTGNCWKCSKVPKKPFWEKTAILNLQYIFIITDSSQFHFLGSLPLGQKSQRRVATEYK